MHCEYFSILCGNAICYYLPIVEMNYLLYRTLGFSLSSQFSEILPS
uniref:Uncharacterized protein n=1 Tax=Rhizophora mucronata TaxID=61149 RepID=A0A2P2MK16_RHIMU